MTDKNIQDTSQVINDSFIKGLNKDSDPSYVTEGMWTHAINMVNNATTGKIGSISNETANYLCFNTGTYFPATVTEKHVIGAIYLFSDKWVIYTAGHNISGQPIASEIGLFEEDQCIYRPIVIDSCLNFDKRNLISGASRLQADCSWQVYWADGLNADRYLNIGDPQTWPASNYTFGGATGLTANFYSDGVNKILWPGVKWEQDCSIVNSCKICTDKNTLDCDGIRLASLMTTPELTLKPGQSGGTLANGTYFAVIAYLIKGQKVTNYFSQSNYQFIYTPQDLQGSIDIDVKVDEEHFEEFELVIVSCVNQQTVAKRIGVYSTNTKRISLDQIDPTTITVPLEQIPIQNPVFETSDQMTEINNYLLRVGPRSKFDFNYQPLANQIQAKWASVEYPADYYTKGGNKTNYMRDEVYAFFIRWVYNTGDKSASYHIPGRAPADFQIPGGALMNELDIVSDKNALVTDEQVFEIYNTASILPSPLVGTATNDGGTIIATGNMGYWQSSENYPDNKPEIWNASQYCWTSPDAQAKQYDLCGKNIRHHKFPENFINNSNSDVVSHFKPNSGVTGNKLAIRILGVYFENIIIPKDNDGNDIPGIVGYEILRGSREGNKTIIAKGMVNNFRTYGLPGSTNGTLGLYPNYPFNCITPPSSNWGGNVQGMSDPFIYANIAQSVPDDIFSFHSPDTMFRTPFLSTSEFKLYGKLSGQGLHQFVEPSDHPKFKLLSNFTLLPMILGGVAEAIIAMTGKRTQSTATITPGAWPSSGTGAGVAQATAYSVAAPIFAGALQTYNEYIENYYSSGIALLDIGAAFFGGSGSTSLNLANTTLNTAATVASVAGVTTSFTIPATIELPTWAYLPAPLRITGALNQLVTYFAQGAELVTKILYATTSYKQYALQQMCYGFYNNMSNYNSNDLLRYIIDDSFYLRDNLQQVSGYTTNTGAFKSYSINNLRRSDTVTLRTKSGPYYGGGAVNIGPSLLTGDNSLVTIASARRYITGTSGPLQFDKFDTSFNTNIQSHYGALKGRVRNQYGQLESIKQFVITPYEQQLSKAEIFTTGPFYCGGYPYTYKTIAKTPVFFGGDTYINRYTEKNNMMFFYDWLYNQPDGFEFNYFLRSMIPRPRFGVNSTLYDIGNLSSIIDFSNFSYGTGAFPADNYNLDYEDYDYNNDTASNYPGLMSPKESFFYLTCSSIRDFFVESDVLVDFWEQPIDVAKKHYSPYNFTNYQSMFDINPQVMGVNSEYKYDYSLSVSKLYNQYFSSGNTQSRYYDPNIAALCYTYYPDRIIYSLPQQNEMIKDSWFVYLANNYSQFKSHISGVKSINKSGIIITFKNDSPVMYQGVDTLQTELGTKITIGDGGLFSQPSQQLTNAEKAYEYGASQNRLSVISTPVGIYYMSESAGKIFALGDGLQEISQQGMKWWFTLFLPYKLTQDFPNYPYQDNPVAGIGCQSVYDNTNGILYFSKKDYQLREEFAGKVTYVGLTADKKGDYFVLDSNPTAQYRLGDDFLFRDASWTISYDPKNQFWISFHDWHPDLFMPTKDVFISTKGTGGWRHNGICDKYCNYYGVDYACEIDMPITTGQTVMTTRSIEYIMEAYRKNYNNCVDSHHVLDFNFDKVVFYNSEQVSGYLNLNVYPKNNLVLARQYPKLNGNLQSFDILFSKEENKYRFNQFWDITKNRGEFPTGSTYPPTGVTLPNSTVLAGNYNNQHMWLTEPDGYTRILNPANLDYNKPQMQRKKFRHYMNFLNLKRTYSGDVNIVLKINNSKNELSQR